MRRSQHLLFDMLSSIRKPTRTQFQSMLTSDWEELKVLARDHRLEPLLHDAIRKSGQNWDIPAILAQDWRNAYRNAALSSLHFDRTFNDLKKVFETNQIAFFVLKGGWLVRRIYDHPALRPMRDLDILVRRDNVISAFDLLLKSGFERLEEDNTPIEYAFAKHKHLPVLVHKLTGILLELHMMVLSDGDSAGTVTALDEENLFSDNLPAATDAHFLNNELNMVHLIAHAVDEHFFDNGPVVLLDIRKIIEKEDVDWPKFWEIAESGRWTAASCLVFDLIERHFGPQPITSRPQDHLTTPSHVLEAASELCTQPADRRAQNALKTSFARSGRTLSELLALSADRLTAKRHVLASELDLSPNSRFAWLAYPKWFWQRAGYYLSNAWGDRRKPSLQKVVMDWIRTET